MQVNDTIIIVYFLVAINFMFNRLKDFSCHTQNLLTDNLIAKHAFNLASVFFVIVLFTRNNPIHPGMLILFTFLLYMLFMIITRCEYRFLIIFLVCMIIVFFIEATKSYYKQKEKQSQKAVEKVEISELQRELVRVQLIIHTLSLFIVCIGFLVYVGQKSREYPNWSWKKFWLGSGQCSVNYLPLKLRRNIARDILDGVKRIFK